MGSNVAAEDLAEGNLRRLAGARRQPYRRLLPYQLSATGHTFLLPPKRSLHQRPSVLKDLARRVGSLAGSPGDGVAAVYLERSSALPSLHHFFIPVVSDAPTLIKGPVKTTLILQ